MKKSLKKIPKFDSESEEFEFWQTHSADDYFHLSQLRPARFPKLKLSSSPITIRMPDAWIDRIKLQAQQTDMPYQTLIKQFVYKGLFPTQNEKTQ